MDVEAFLEAVRGLAEEADRVVSSLALDRGQFAVNVHAYALAPYEAFVRRYYSDAEPRVGAVAMNPGRNGAVQTGIPFTDLDLASELLPDFERLVGRRHPRIPQGSREMSGRRLLRWGLARFADLETFYRQMLFYITCPIAVMTEEPVRNVPLPSLGAADRRRVLDLIIGHLPRLIDASAPIGVVLLGRYAQNVWQAADTSSVQAEVAPHPAARITPGAFASAMDRAFDGVRGERF